MKIKDVMRIGLKNIRIYFRRNLLIMAVMGVVFGLIFAINLWFYGMRNNYVEMAGRLTNGGLIIEATNSIEGMIIENVTPRATREEMIADIERYGGKVLGDTEKWNAFGGVVLPEEIAKRAMNVELGEVPEDAVPVIATTFMAEQLLGESFSADYRKASAKAADYKRYREAVVGRVLSDRYGTKYYVAELGTGGFHIGNMSFRQLERGDENVLNPVLEFVSVLNGVPVIIDNGKSEKWSVAEKDMGRLPQAGEATVTAVFENRESAYEFLRKGKGGFINVEFPNREYTVDVVVGMSPEIEYALSIMQVAVRVISVLLGVAAMIVVVFTSIRLVDQNKQNIALYYSLGATTKQIFAIYLCYFVGLMIGALVLAFGLASSIVLLFSAVNQEMLGIQAMLAFNFETVPSVVWYGVNVDTLMITIAGLVLAGVCVLVNGKRLKNRVIE